MKTNAAARAPRAKSALQHMRRRREFVHAAESGVRHSTRFFKLQAAARESDRDAPARFGFTVTSKTAGAVGRNRIRRRLREAVRIGGGLDARPGYDYVFVARPAALTAPFGELVSQIADGLARIHVRGNPSSRRNRKDGSSAS